MGGEIEKKRKREGIKNRDTAKQTETKRKRHRERKNKKRQRKWEGRGEKGIRGAMGSEGRGYAQHFE